MLLQLVLPKNAGFPENELSRPCEFKEKTLKTFPNHFMAINFTYLGRSRQAEYNDIKFVCFCLRFKLQINFKVLPEEGEKGIPRRNSLSSRVIT